MSRGTGTASCATARGSLAAPADPRFGVTSRRALGLDDPISPLYALPDDAPAPEVSSPEEAAALVEINKARIALGYGPLPHLRGGHRSGWRRHDALDWALVTAMPLTVRIRSSSAFGKESLNVQIPVGTDYGHYDKAVAAIEKLADGFGVELRRGPYDAPMASYGPGTVNFTMPLPEALRDYLKGEQPLSWQPAEPQPVVSPALLKRVRDGVKIKGKAEMYKLYEAGAFGNKLRTWTSTDAFLADDYKGLVTLRYKAAAGGGGWCAYDVPADKVTETVAQWVSEGADPALVAVNESAPDEKLIVQGDVGRLPEAGGFVFNHASEKTKMRIAMKNSQHSYGIEAQTLLREQLSPNSYDDVMTLLDLYPGSIVEFSAYAMNVGQLPGRNAVIWEVRNY
jgi:hypothetical protein